MLLCDPALQVRLDILEQSPKAGGLISATPWYMPITLSWNTMYARDSLAVPYAVANKSQILQRSACKWLRPISQQNLVALQNLDSDLDRKALVPSVHPLVDLSSQTNPRSPRL